MAVPGGHEGVQTGWVLFSVFLWSFLWGMFGAFIGVPITIAALTYCMQAPSTRWISQLLGSGRIPSGHD